MAYNVINIPEENNRLGWCSWKIATYCGLGLLGVSAVAACVAWGLGGFAFASGTTPFIPILKPTPAHVPFCTASGVPIVRDAQICQVLTPFADLVYKSDPSCPWEGARCSVSEGNPTVEVTYNGQIYFSGESWNATELPLIREATILTATEVPVTLTCGDAQGTFHLATTLNFKAPCGDESPQSKQTLSGQ